jgi:Domain of unknown function (DUF4390)
MDFSMRCWKNIVSALLSVVLLAGCAGADGAAQLRVRGARLANGVLTAQLQWQPNDAVLDALDHGIALEFLLRVRAYGPARFGWRPTLARADRHIELRYFPLSRRYQMRDLDRGETRTYGARGLLVAALEDLHLALPTDWAGRAAQSFALSIDLERDNLPGALRLPALLNADWHLSSGDFAWAATDAG